MPRQLREKHQNRIWKDHCGDIWYFDERRLRWMALLASLDGYYVESLISPTEFDGPFKEIARNRVYGLP